MENYQLDENGQVVKTETIDLQEFIAQKQQELSSINESIAFMQAKAKVILDQLQGLVG